MRVVGLKLYLLAVFAHLTDREANAIYDYLLARANAANELIASRGQRA